eukprot:7391879-Prymnesium_polylepis.3
MTRFSVEPRLSTPPEGAQQNGSEGKPSMPRCRSRGRAARSSQPRASKPLTCAAIGAAASGYVDSRLGASAITAMSSAAPSPEYHWGACTRTPSWNRAAAAWSGASANASAAKACRTPSTRPRGREVGSLRPDDVACQPSKESRVRPAKSKAHGSSTSAWQSGGSSPSGHAVGRGGGGRCGLEAGMCASWRHSARSRVGSSYNSISDRRDCGSSPKGTGRARSPRLPRKRRSSIDGVASAARAKPVRSSATQRPARASRDSKHAVARSASGPPASCMAAPRPTRSNRGTYAVGRTNEAARAMASATTVTAVRPRTPRSGIHPPPPFWPSRCAASRVQRVLSAATVGTIAMRSITDGLTLSSPASHATGKVGRRSSRRAHPSATLTSESRALRPTALDAAP